MDTLGDGELVEVMKDGVDMVTGMRMFEKTSVIMNCRGDYFNSRVWK